jgi:hypothetical protein
MTVHHVCDDCGYYWHDDFMSDADGCPRCDSDEVIDFENERKARDYAITRHPGRRFAEDSA